jgi:hypothetical protein
MSPLPFALVLLSIVWARCLGEMITVRRASLQHALSPQSIGKHFETSNDTLIILRVTCSYFKFLFYRLEYDEKCFM